MQTNIPLLDDVKIAAPCPKRWEDMIGGERVRFCRDCSKNVYNLSEMTKEEAEKLLQTHEGRLCVQFYRRGDGKILTQNCPVGLRTLRRAFLKTMARVSALWSAIVGGGVFLLSPVQGGAYERRPSLDTVEYREQEILKLKRQLEDKKKPLTAEEREDLQGDIDFFREKLKSDLSFLQREAEE